MTNIELFFLLLYTSGVTIISYSSYARKRGWPVGTMFDSDSSIIKIIGILAIFGSAIAAFFFIKWYLVLIGLVGGWLLSGAISAIFTRHTQLLSVVLFLVSWLFLLIRF